MYLKKTIKVKLQVEGIHSWPEAKDVFPEVGFLSDPHRHIFHISLTKSVTHNDRDIEIIMFKRTIINYLQDVYQEGYTKCLNFGRKSCEDIAEELLLRFDLDWVEVLEDNENGAVIEKDFSL